MNKGKVALEAIGVSLHGPLDDTDHATEYLRRALAYMRAKGTAPWDDLFGTWCDEDEDVLDFMVGVREALTKDFDPDQPRVPAGVPEGGQFAGVADSDTARFQPTERLPKGESDEKAARTLSNAGIMRDTSHRPVPVTPEAIEANLDLYFRQATAAQVESGKAWYPKAREFAETLRTRFPGLHLTSEQACAVVASCAARAEWDDRFGTSEQAKLSNQALAIQTLERLNENPEIDVTRSLARKLVKAGKEAGIALDPGDLIGQKVRLRDLPPHIAHALGGFKGLPAHTIPVMRMMRGETIDEALGGAKVRSFYANMARVGSSDDNAVTYDTWMMRASFNNLSLTGPHYAKATKTVAKYELVADAVRRIAKREGLTPREVQAIIWESYRSKNAQRREGRRTGVSMVDWDMKLAYREQARRARELKKKGGLSWDDDEEFDESARLMYACYLLDGRYAEFFDGPEDEVVKEFDPYQERDERGRWTTAPAPGPAGVSDERRAKVSRVNAEAKKLDEDAENLSDEKIIERLHGLQKMMGTGVDDHNPVMIMGAGPPVSEINSYLARAGAKDYPGAYRPPDVEQGEHGRCYENATRLMMRDPDRFEYCEGIAYRPNTAGLAFLHAWCIDKNTGEVVDPTWEDAQDCKYYGVKYDRNAYMRHVVKTKFYGVLGGDTLDAMRVMKRGGL